MHPTDPYKLPKNELKLYFIDMIYPETPTWWSKDPNKKETDAQAPETAPHDNFQILKIRPELTSNHVANTK